jgi:hypothetical protein
LSAQVKSLQTQLSSSSKTKVKTPGRGLLVELTAEAGTVSSGLSTCVGDMNSLTAEISHDLANPSYKDPHLQSNTQSADQVCATARQDNQHLQSTLSAAA